MQYKFVFVIIGIIGALAAFRASSYAAAPTVEQSVPDRVLNAPQKNIITLVVENDSFGGGTDKNYTSGVRINFTDVNAKFPDIAYKIDKLIPTFEINKTSSIY